MAARNGITRSREKRGSQGRRTAVWGLQPTIVAHDNQEMNKISVKEARIVGNEAGAYPQLGQDDGIHEPIQYDENNTQKLQLLQLLQQQYYIHVV